METDEELQTDGDAQSDEELSDSKYIQSLFYKIFYSRQVKAEKKNIMNDGEQTV